jgi:subfamily B ATP-binding cassette protein MsbA
MGCILTPTSGRVTVAGAPVDSKRSDHLRDVRRKSIGFVFQQYNLFPALTALENVEYSLNVKGVRGRAAGKEATRVLERVGLGDRLHFLPRDLSGGQKQRVAIARAVLADPRILILDEATSSLDSESEALIQEGLKHLLQGRTTFVIAHRLSTIRRADQILVVEQGRIIERGNHAQLYARQGRYYEMYTRQHGLEMNLFLAPGEGDRVEEPEVVAAPAPARRTGLLGE